MNDQDLAKYAQAYAAGVHAEIERHRAELLPGPDCPPLPETLDLARRIRADASIPLPDHYRNCPYCPRALASVRRFLDREEKAAVYFHMRIRFTASTPPGKVFFFAQTMIQHAWDLDPELGLTYDTERSRSDDQGDIILVLRAGDVPDARQRVAKVESEFRALIARVRAGEKVLTPLADMIRDATAVCEFSGEWLQPA
jgi:hypothetical protein